MGINGPNIGIVGPGIGISGPSGNQGGGTTPVITSMSPRSGPLVGGTSVTIVGVNFTGATAVKFGAINAASFVVNGPTSISAVTPSGLTGVVDVKITTPAGTSLSIGADRYTYAAVPVVTGLSPSTGPTAGGTPVAITGTGFLSASLVTFGGVTATFVVNSSTSISAMSPAGTGVVDVEVTTPGGTSADVGADQFTYSGGGGSGSTFFWIGF